MDAEMELEPAVAEVPPPAPEAPAEKGKRVLTEAQLEILKKAREKAVEARREKADARKAEKGLKDKQAELQRVKVVLETKALEEELAAAKSGGDKKPVEQTETPGPKKGRAKRRPNAPGPKRSKVYVEPDTEAMDEDEWDEWSEEEEPARPVRPPPRHAVPYHAALPRANAFDMHAKAAYQQQIDQMKRDLIYRSVWGGIR